jgi:nitrate/nitrite transporter NarK
LSACRPPAHLVHHRTGLTPILAGYATAACVFAGSLVRPIGGALADRVGGIKTLSLVYAGAVLLGASPQRRPLP